MRNHFAWAMLMLAAVTIAHLAHGVEPAANPPQAGDENVDVAYARAKLRLAEANLQKIERMNERVPNAVSGNVANQYRADVETARARLQDVLQDGGQTDFSIWLRNAQDNWQAADVAWKSAVAANTHQLNTVDALDVERLRLRAELCRASLARGKSLADQPRAVQLEWRVAVLSDEVDRLREQVFRNPTPAAVYPFWWY